MKAVKKPIEPMEMVADLRRRAQDLTHRAQDLTHRAERLLDAAAVIEQHSADLQQSWEWLVDGGYDRSIGG